MSVLTSARSLIRIVELVIVFGDGVAKVIPIDWSRGTTAEDALKRAREKPHGISFHISIHPLGAFVTEIDGEANDADGYVNRGWIYSVNGDIAKVGCGEYELKPSDIVRWEYTVCDQPIT